MYQVCRLCQQQDEKPSCSACGTLENLWVCVICGFVACGRYCIYNDFYFDNSCMLIDFKGTKLSGLYIYLVSLYFYHYYVLQSLIVLLLFVFLFLIYCNFF